MTFLERINQDLTTAMKNKEADRLSTLRMVKTAIKNREIEKMASLTDDEAIKLLQSMVKQRRDSISQYEQAGRKELAEKEAGEIRIIEEYLPAALDEAAGGEQLHAEVPRRWIVQTVQFLRGLIFVGELERLRHRGLHAERQLIRLDAGAQCRVIRVLRRSKTIEPAHQIEVDALLLLADARRSLAELERIARINADRNGVMRRAEVVAIFRVPVLAIAHRDELGQVVVK